MPTGNIKKKLHTFRCNCNKLQAKIYEKCEPIVIIAQIIIRPTAFLKINSLSRDHIWTIN